MKRPPFLFFFTIALLMVLNPSSLRAQGTAFTYQGRLNDGGKPATGLYDLRFRLSADSFGNSYVGTAYLTNGIAVSNGLFTTTVDFGPGLFAGAPYWLEIDVRTNGAGGYNALFPLQQFTAAPYSIFAGSANSIGGQTAANVAVAATAANGATNSSTPDTIVKRDANGDFSAATLSLTHSLEFLNDGVTPWTINILTGGATNSVLVADTYGNIGLGIDCVVPSSGNSETLNTGLGAFALKYLTNGSQNIGLGASALSGMTGGFNNIAVGYNAGTVGGSNNIDIGYSAADTENGTMHLGASGTQTNTYVAGVYNTTVSSGVPVYVAVDGHLGTISSSQKYKQNVAPMGDTSDVLLALQPVTFQYKPDIDPQGTPQFGLIAEQVEKADPDLVVHDPEHGIYTVRYQAVDAMLLNEFLKQHKTLLDQNATIRNLKQQNDSLEKRLEKLERRLSN